MDAIPGAGGQLGLAEMEAWTGQPKNATKRVRHLLSIPFTICIAHLKNGPVWDPIRNDPEFQQLLTMKEHVGQ